MPDTNDIRCFCRHHPLLAKWGVDEKKGPYIHQRAFKSQQVIAESLVYGGEAHIRCRECYRWTRVRLRVATAVVSAPVDGTPEVLQPDPPVNGGPPIRQESRLSAP